MSYQILARKWRPQTFDELIGQEAIKRTLKNAVTSGHIAHAYLFSGPRGVGKTTIARILSKALNCEQGPTANPCCICENCLEIAQGRSMDVIEIDGASNNSVDNIRELRENIKYTTIRSKYKVYIIDEVHMLSISAFNALLKTLEEPPNHVVFIFATTELHKIPKTILSRCQYFEFSLISSKEIIRCLSSLAAKEGIVISEQGLSLIARIAGGSLRDAESLLDQVTSYCGQKILDDEIVEFLGLVKREDVFKLLLAIIKKDNKEVLICVENFVESGYDISYLYQEILQCIRDIIVLKTIGDDYVDELIDFKEEEKKELKSQLVNVFIDDLHQIFYLFTQEEQVLKRSGNPRIIFEVLLLRLTSLERLCSIEKILDGLGNLSSSLPSLPLPQGETKVSSLSENETSTTKISVKKNDGQQTIDDRQRMSVDETSMPGKDIKENRSTSTSLIFNNEEQQTKDQKQNDKQQIIGKDIIGQYWPDILLEIKEKKPALESVLKNTSLKVKDNGQLEFSCKKKYSFYLDQQESKEIIGSILSKYVGQRPLFCFAYEEEKLNDEVGNDDQSMKSAKRRAESRRKEIINEPIVKKALEIFKGEIVNVKHLQQG
ncbi:MAG: DNA polymerase III subunit gamma/tau [bacterium]